MYKKPRKSLTWVTKTFTWTIFNLDLDQIDLLDTKHITTSEHAYTQYENVFTNVFNKHAQSKTRQTRKKPPLPCMNNELCMANTCYIHNTRRNEIQKHGRNSENSVI